MTLLAFSPKKANSSRNALAMSSLAFGVSALASAAANQLSLYHVILAAKFQSLSLIVTTIVEVRSPRYRSAYLFAVNRMRWAVNAAIILWYSITAPCFGVKPECNSYVRSKLYFTVGHATKMPQRLTSIANTALVLLLIINDLCRACYKRKRKSQFPGWGSRNRKREVERLGEATDLLYLYTLVLLSDNSIPLIPHTFTASLPPPATMTNPHPSRIKYIARRVATGTRAVAAALAYPKFMRYIVAMVILIMLVCNIEQTIALNMVDAGDNAWTYGQFLAVVLTVPPIVDVLRLLGILSPGRLVKLKAD